ncbi:hypothetical protein UJ101_01408 [Flavobacteriaceae bacterium UJ101]|nr:hypothetical protein UJ101_01408 [Flavobacteriaceae bacterium UJ101]
MLDNIKLKTFYLDLKESKSILRCVLGVCFALIFCTTMDYPGAHMTAIFTLMFLDVGKQPLGFKKEIGIVIVLYILGFVGVYFGNYLIDYPLVIIPTLGLIIFWSFRSIIIPQPIRLLFLLLVVLIPFISIQANALGDVVLDTLLFNVVIALLIVRLAFFIFPFSKKEIIKTNQQEATKLINYDKVAFNGLVVVFPIVLLFYVFNSNIALLTLVFIIILAFDPFIYQSKKGLALVVANILGGLAGIIVYNILVIAPSYVLYILLIISTAFYFVTNLFSGKKIAPVYKISFNTFFVVMGVISSSDNDAGSTLRERLFQIMLAVFYVVMAFKMMNVLNNPITDNNE